MEAILWTSLSVDSLVTVKNKKCVFQFGENGALLCPHRPALQDCAIRPDKSQITGLENEFGRTLDLVCDSDYLLATKFAGHFSTAMCETIKVLLLSFNVQGQISSHAHRYI